MKRLLLTVLLCLPILLGVGEGPGEVSWPDTGSSGSGTEIDQNGDGNPEVSCDGTECIVDYNDTAGDNKFVALGPGSMTVVDLADTRTWENPSGSCCEALRDAIEPFMDVTGTTASRTGTVYYDRECATDQVKADFLQVGPNFTCFGVMPRDAAYADDATGDPASWVTASHYGGSGVEANFRLVAGPTASIDFDLSGFGTTEVPVLMQNGTAWHAGSDGGEILASVELAGSPRFTVTTNPSTDTDGTVPIQHDATLMLKDIDTVSADTPVTVGVANLGLRRAATNDFHPTIDMGSRNSSIPLFSYGSWGTPIVGWQIVNSGPALFVGGHDGVVVRSPYWRESTMGLLHLGDPIHGNQLNPATTCAGTDCTAYTQAIQLTLDGGVIEGKGGIQVFVGDLTTTGGFFTEPKGSAEHPVMVTPNIGIGMETCDGTDGDWHVAREDAECSGAGATVAPTDGAPGVITLDGTGARDLKDHVISGIGFGDSFLDADAANLILSGELKSSYVYPCAAATGTGLATCVDVDATTNWAGGGNETVALADNADAAPLSNGNAIIVTSVGGINQKTATYSPAATLDFSEGTDDRVFLRLYLPQTIFDSLDLIGKESIRVVFGDDNSNRRGWKFCAPGSDQASCIWGDTTPIETGDEAELRVGWNVLPLVWADGAALGTGTQDNTSVDWFQVEIHTTTTAGWGSEGFILDSIYADTAEEHAFEPSAAADGYVNASGAEKRTDIVGPLDYTNYMGTSAPPPWDPDNASGAAPPAYCRPGMTFLDTDETDDTNCTTTADNSMCVCTATNTWTALENN